MSSQLSFGMLSAMFYTFTVKSPCKMNQSCMKVKLSEILICPTLGLHK